MQCPKCNFINPEDAKFCQNCGQPLPQVCPNCGTPNARTAKFCKNCGNRLAGAAPGDSGDQGQVAQASRLDPRHARLAASAPQPLVEKMRAAAHLAGERRVVTALFADVVGSTALTEQMDPEDWTAVMNRAFEQLVPVVYRYEGTIARLMGDALLAFFGAPVAHEDDPVRAVKAGLDLLKTASEYAHAVRQKYGIDFAIRVGLNTGPVVVGEVGSNLVYEYTAMGDAINLAARMQAAARPMTVLIAENTNRFVAPFFECIDVGEIAVKGKQALVHAYEVKGAKHKPGRVRGLAGLESPMVGRQSQLSTLGELSEAVSSGLGRAALVLGEAGLGKSRLVAEWKAMVSQQHSLNHREPVWVEGHCLSYGQGLAYHLLADLLGDVLEVASPDGELGQYERLRLLCQDLFGGAQAGHVVPYLGHLLSLEMDEEDQERVTGLDPQGLQNRYFNALSQLLLGLTEDRALVIVLEDVHWADPSSIELLVQLLPLSTQAPILFCVVSRPDQEAPGWKLVSAMRERIAGGLTEIDLRALSEQDARQLVSNLLEIEALPENARRIILNKAEGNPYFVEEVIRVLIDQGTLKEREGRWIAPDEIDTIDIPDTVQGLLLARIDRLPEEIKRTLRVAAVIGRRFSVRLLEQVFMNHDLGHPQELNELPYAIKNHLSRLESLGLLRVAQIQPELEYLFRHALVHEVTYQSLVKRDRQQLHLAVGETLENLYPDRLVAFAPVLGAHFAEAEQDEKAVEYLTLAGDQAASQYANTEACMVYDRALGILKRNLSLDADVRQQLTGLYLKRGRILELMGHYGQAVESYSEMEAFARRQEDREMELASLVAQSVIYSTPSSVFDAKEGETSASRALSLADELGDRAAKAKILWALLLHNFFLLKPDKGKEYGLQSLALARELDLREQLAYTLSDLANFAYMDLGEFDQAIEVLKEAEGLWREMDNLPMLSNSLVYLAYNYFFTGQFDLALASTGEALQISESIANLWGQSYSLGTSAFVLIERGDFHKARTALEESIRLSSQSGFAASVPIARTLQARLYLELGALEQAYQFATQSVELAESGFPFWLPASLGTLASTLGGKGEFDLATQQIDRARALTQESGMLVFYPYILEAACIIEMSRDDYRAALDRAQELLDKLQEIKAHAFLPYGLYTKGWAQMALGDLGQARGTLKEAERVAEEMTSRRIWWKILGLLSEVSARQGDEQQAEAYRRKARQIVDEIAGKIDVADLRDRFLNLPSVSRYQPPNNKL